LEELSAQTVKEVYTSNVALEKIADLV